MKIICLNGWGGMRHAALCDWIGVAQPDVLCLQEVIHTPTSPQDWLVYSDSEHVLDQRARFLDDVRGVLPGFQVTFCPAACGPLWLGDQAIPSFWGLATFVRGDLPVIAQAQGFVHGSYGADGFGAHPRSRTGHAVRVHDARLGRAVSITQMHGLRDLRGKMDTPERAAQAGRLLNLSDSVTQPGDLRVICGDFNVEPESETLTLLRQAGLTELVTHSGAPGARTHDYSKPGKFADYMAVNDLCAVAGFDVIRDPEVSDHCTLVLTLQPVTNIVSPATTT